MVFRLGSAQQGMQRSRLPLLLSRLCGCMLGVLVVSLRAGGASEEIPWTDACATAAQASKVAVMVNSDSGGDLESQVQGLIEDILYEIGFGIIDTNVVQSAISDAQRQLLFSGDKVAALQAADALNADLLMMVKVGVSSRAVNHLKTNLQSVSVGMSYRMVARDSGAVLSVFRLTDRTAGLDEGSAVILYLEKRSEEIAGKVKKDFCGRILKGPGGPSPMVGLGGEGVEPPPSTLVPGAGEKVQDASNLEDL